MDEYSCPNCKYVFKSFSDYVDSADSGCEYCGKTFKEDISMTHRLKHMYQWIKKR